MSVENKENSDKTKEDGIIKPPVPEKEPINEKEVGVGITPEGFWIFKIHKTAGLHEVLGFLEMSKDVVKAGYVAQSRANAAEAQKKSLLRPGNIDAIVKKVKR